MISALRGEIERHPAVNHIFLHRCATSPFAREDYRVFGEQHFPLACFFATSVPRVLRRAEGREARARLSPLIDASRAEDDRALYERFLRAAKSVVPGEARVEVHRPAYRFIREIQRIVAKEPLLVALGATAPIAAWAAPRMFASILPGLRRAGFAEEEIGYFARHEQEGEAAFEATREALVAIASTGEAREELRRGALLCLSAYGAFWTGAQSAVVRYRQPRAARPDGPRPRSAVHEILLTAWDGLRVAQILEQEIALREARARPSLAELLSL